MNTPVVSSVPVLSDTPVEFTRRGESVREAAERRFGPGVEVIPAGSARLGVPFIGVVRRTAQGPSYRVFPAAT